MGFFKLRGSDGRIRIRTLLYLLCLFSVLIFIQIFGLVPRFNTEDTKVYSSSSGWGDFFRVNLENKKVDIEKLVKRYYREDYSIDIAVVDVKDNSTKDKVSYDVKFKVRGSSDVYSFEYIHDEDSVDINETYGSILTSRIITKKVNELLGDSLPKSSELWVECNSLVNITDKKPYEMFEIMEDWDTGDFYSFNGNNELIKSVNYSIISGGTPRLSRYEDDLKMLTRMLSSKGGKNLELNVGFFKGNKSMSLTMEDVSNRLGVSESNLTDGTVAINWLDEIPKVEDVKRYMWGTVHIEKDAYEVLNYYYGSSKEKAKGYKTDDGTILYDIEIYSDVKDVL